MCNITNVYYESDTFLRLRGLRHSIGEWDYQKQVQESMGNCEVGYEPLH